MPVFAVTLEYLVFSPVIENIWPSYGANLTKVFVSILCIIIFGKFDFPFKDCSLRFYVCSASWGIFNEDITFHNKYLQKM